ncbi:MAG TPA: hypothetical protein VLG25_02555 [Patescibacteria group bacterium]|nr:hypothetical protein [Patescibacteria group bacterium]
MENAETVLVVFLSGALAVFLILGIFALIKVNQILEHLRHISEKAESIADKAEAVGEFFEKTAGPVAIGKLLSNVVEAVKGHKSSKKRSKDK